MQIDELAKVQAEVGSAGKRIASDSKREYFLFRGAAADARAAKQVQHRFGLLAGVLAPADDGEDAADGGGFLADAPSSQTHSAAAGLLPRPLAPKSPPREEKSHFTTQAKAPLPGLLGRRGEVVLGRVDRFAHAKRKAGVEALSSSSDSDGDDQLASTGATAGASETTVTAADFASSDSDDSGSDSGDDGSVVHVASASVGRSGEAVAVDNAPTRMRDHGAGAGRLPGSDDDSGGGFMVDAEDDDMGGRFIEDDGEPSGGGFMPADGGDDDAGAGQDNPAAGSGHDADEGVELEVYVASMGCPTPAHLS